MSGQAPAAKNFSPSWDRFHQDSLRLAWRLNEKREKKPILGPWQAIIAVTRGGMYPAARIGRELGIRVIDTVGVALYDYQVQGEEVEVLKPISQWTLDNFSYENGRHILVIDDLVDTGKTAKKVRSMLPPDIHYATLYSKPAGEGQVNTYISQVSQDTWIYFPWDTGLELQTPIHKLPPEQVARLGDVGAEVQTTRGV